MGSKFRIVVPAQFDKWVSGFKTMEIGPQEASLFEAAAEVFFSETQDRVHVISGDLKTSGHLGEAVVFGKTLVVEVTYGGVQGTKGPVDYTEYELARGGTHDFIRPAVVRTESVFEESVLDMMIALIQRKVG